MNNKGHIKYIVVVLICISVLMFINSFNKQSEYNNSNLLKLELFSKDEVKMDKLSKASTTLRIHRINCETNINYGGKGVQINAKLVGKGISSKGATINKQLYDYYISKNIDLINKKVIIEITNFTYDSEGKRNNITSRNELTIDQVIDDKEKGKFNIYFSDFNLSKIEEDLEINEYNSNLIEDSVVVQVDSLINIPKAIDIFKRNGFTVKSAYESMDTIEAMNYVNNFVLKIAKIFISILSIIILINLILSACYRNAKRKNKGKNVVNIAMIMLWIIVLCSMMNGIKLITNKAIIDKNQLLDISVIGKIGNKQNSFGSIGDLEFLSNKIDNIQSKSIKKELSPEVYVYYDNFAQQCSDVISVNKDFEKENNINIKDKNGAAVNKTFLSEFYKTEDFVNRDANTKKNFLDVDNKVVNLKFNLKYIDGNGKVSEKFMSLPIRIDEVINDSGPSTIYIPLERLDELQKNSKETVYIYDEAKTIVTLKANNINQVNTILSKLTENSYIAISNYNDLDRAKSIISNNELEIKIIVIITIILAITMLITFILPVDKHSVFVGLITGILLSLLVMIIINDVYKTVVPYEKLENIKICNLGNFKKLSSQKNYSLSASNQYFLKFLGIIIYFVVSYSNSIRIYK